MKLAPIAVVIVLFGAIAGSVALALSNDGRVASSDQSGESANAPGMTAAPTVVGWQFKQDDVACIHLSDTEHLLKIAHDHDSTAYQNYADQNECYGMHKGATVHLEDGGSYDYGQVVEVRKDGSANSLYTLMVNLGPVFSGDADAMIEQAEQDGNVAPLVADENAHAAGQRANVNGTINRPVEACESHGGECITLREGTKVIISASEADGSSEWVYIANPSAGQPQDDLSVVASAITP